MMIYYQIVKILKNHSNQKIMRMAENLKMKFEYFDRNHIDLKCYCLIRQIYFLLGYFVV